MKRVNKWFTDVFLESFDSGVYYAQDTWLKKWQYAQLMELAKANNWNMLSPKQWEVFSRYADFISDSHGDYARITTATKDIYIKIGSTGLAKITIADV